MIPTPYFPLSDARVAQALIKALYDAGLTHGGRSRDNALETISIRVGYVMYYHHRDRAIYATNANPAAYASLDHPLLRANSPRHFISMALAIKREEKARSPAPRSY